MQRRGIIAELAGTETVSLRGTVKLRDNYQPFQIVGLLDAFSEPVFRKVIGKLPMINILDLPKLILPIALA